MKLNSSFQFVAGILILFLLVVSAPEAASAAPMTIPSGLNPGDQYRLAFVTSTGHDAMSADVADYNAFAASLANAVPALSALGTTWTVLASTAAVDARDNTLTNPGLATGVAIYNLGGSLVAGNNADLWDGALQAPIQFDETGTSLSVVVHTGTDTAGQGIPSSQLGEPGITAGYSTATTSLWLTGQPGDNWFFETSLYAISGVLTVVPEPASLTLLGLGSAALLVAGIRPTTRRRSPRVDQPPRKSAAAR